MRCAHLAKIALPTSCGEVHDKVRTQLLAASQICAEICAQIHDLVLRKICKTSRTQGVGVERCEIGIEICGENFPTGLNCS